MASSYPLSMDDNNASSGTPSAVVASDELSFEGSPPRLSPSSHGPSRPSADGAHARLSPSSVKSRSEGAQKRRSASSDRTNLTTHTLSSSGNTCVDMSGHEVIERAYAEHHRKEFEDPRKQRHRRQMRDFEHATKACDPDSPLKYSVFVCHVSRGVVSFTAPRRTSSPSSCVCPCPCPPFVSPTRFRDREVPVSMETECVQAVARGCSGIELKVELHTTNAFRSAMRALANLERRSAPLFLFVHVDEHIADANEYRMLLNKTACDIVDAFGEARIHRGGNGFQTPLRTATAKLYVVNMNTGLYGDVTKIRQSIESRSKVDPSELEVPLHEELVVRAMYESQTRKSEAWESLCCADARCLLDVSSTTANWNMLRKIVYSEARAASPSSGASSTSSIADNVVVRLRVPSNLKYAKSKTAAAQGLHNVPFVWAEKWFPLCTFFLVDAFSRAGEITLNEHRRLQRVFTNRPSTGPDLADLPHKMSIPEDA